MKGTLHKSMNYGWMVQDGLDSFYPIHPYDIFTNSIERVEGKEVDFTVVYSWSSQEEKLIEVAIISVNITDVLFKQTEILNSDECQTFEKMYDTTSATICANCGREKFLHRELGQKVGHNVQVERMYSEDDVRKIIRKAQIRDEYGIFEYPNEDELLKK